ncbi:precorrin-3B C(17)-methyltransferase [Phaeobacter sp. B1627]|uniref:precorrin-3B C(17)-methyltransferase n=1 Tax=Phaeobacter sp. B1627 TaxID=2583809 RepID=UPI001119EE53|nr:precorrin-3B C(17)-methyltransferase [Phaeobacter sp. B1627]TNJ41294.1 precorrin-3B C(17)-methyltransferase [Phaeobacter sp. B1627]
MTPPAHAQSGHTEPGRIVIAGLGPGAEDMVTPEVQAALATATDVVGYIPYVNRIKPRSGLVLHASDNRVEVDRATHALQMAAAGRRVVVVSSGDPGVFAMASAVFEALEAGPRAWRELEVRVLPGITAMLAAAAAIGAPLGHDFAAINLSDNLKPWALIERRLQLVGEAGLAMAFYNPRSKSRPHQFARALEVLRAACGEDTLITFARDVTKPDQHLLTVALRDATPEMADMRTMVIVGTRDTRRVGTYVYTPRFAPGHQPRHQPGAQPASPPAPPSAVPSPSQSDQKED